MKNLFRFLPFVALTWTCLGDTQSAGEPEEIPFRLHRGYMILVQGSIGPLEGLTFLIDTGASAPILNCHIARKLGLETQKVTEAVSYGKRIRSQMTILRDLRIGATHFLPAPAMVKDLSRTFPDIGDRIDAVIGMSILVRVSFRIDFENKTLMLRPVDELPTAAKLDLDKKHLPVLEMEIEGQTVHLLADTGVDQLILFRTRVTGSLKEKRRLSKKTFYHLGAADQYGLVELSDLKLGSALCDRLHGYTLDSRVEGYDGFEGITGLVSLDLRSVQFDFEQGRISWTR